MGYAIALSALLIVGSVGAVLALRRSQSDRGTHRLDAEAEANRWLVRLGGSLIPPGAAAWATGGEAAGGALTRAAECHRAARTLLAEARTAAEYDRVSAVAQEGLRHVHAAREALGLTPDPDAAPVSASVPVPAPTPDRPKVRQAFQEPLARGPLPSYK
ncbi:hypothetical protein [Streptomyces cylindrosporus]|uniref:Uncharacterized protein n=1 Tax=Streptomyces cylindrosporus TaxID=2927583 RepID=A0ABS9YG08_9ACTN|nr:hypothetical protein [Streptomyces cylindrosporus]MCI3274816.1 hypothetical protein [Streptomyces cylindrosporus]